MKGQKEVVSPGLISPVASSQPLARKALPLGRGSEGPYSPPLCNVAGMPAEAPGVIIEPRHFRMMLRGVEEQNSPMTPCSILGSPPLRGRQKRVPQAD
jgi:hypothetical protein